MKAKISTSSKGGPAPSKHNIQSQTNQLAKSISNQAQLARNLAFLETLLATQDIENLAKTVPRPEELSTGLFDVAGPTFGVGQAGRRIGGIPAQPQDPSGKGKTGTGFDDPLAGNRNPRHNTLVGPPKIPGRNDLTGQDTDTADPDTGTRSHDGSSGRPARQVWVERHTERTSPDGQDTWGGTMYRDYAGNSWRSEQHTHRGEDGSVTTTDTIYDSHGEPIKTTVVVASPYGVETETHTDHRTGQTTTRDITPKVAPETGPPDPKKYQPDEAAPQGDPNAPRGWSNPISGVVHNPGLPTSNNKVNPGPEESQPPLEPLRLNPRDLVVNPAPDAPQGNDATPRDIQHDEAGVNIIDPPRPA